MKTVLSTAFRPFITSLCLIVLLACSSEDAVNLVGSDNPFITPNRFFNYDSDSSQTPPFSFQNFSIDSGYATGGYAFVGEEENGAKQLTATTYLKFWAGDFPNVDTATAISATLTLRVENWQDSLAGQNVIFEAKTIVDSWQPASVRSKYPLSVGNEVLAEFSFTIEDSSSIEMTLPKSFADQLLSDIQNGEDYLLDSSKGIALIPKSASTLVSVDFSDSKLRITLDRKTDTGLDERFSKLLDVSSSAYSVETNYSSFSNDAIYLQSVSADGANLTFNLDFLQPEFQIGKATLSITRDTLYSEINDTLNSVGVGLASDDLTVDENTSIKLFSVDSTGAVYSANVTQIVQKWALNQHPNNGFILRPIQELRDFNFWRFYGDQESIGLRPRLTITYAVSE